MRHPPDHMGMRSRFGGLGRARGMDLYTGDPLTRWKGGTPRGGGYQTVAPPSTGSTAPVMKADSSLAKNTAAQAMSSGRPKRPSG